MAKFNELKPDSEYYYQVFDEADRPILFEGLTPDNLRFRTFPAGEKLDRIDFLLMSCHDPGQVRDDGMDGFRVWSAVDQIRESNPIRFALLVGDQIYGDYVQEKALGAKTEKERLRLYLAVYQKLWSHPIYRKALCGLPAYLMWDDHDITDGWGSRSDSFVDVKSSELSPEWKDLFNTAKRAFEQMQASRNPEPLSRDPNAGFDFAFSLGRAGFAVSDLRSHRNVRKHQIWSPLQFQALKDWVIRNIEDFAGFRDDLEDAWSSDPNQAAAEELLDFLFELQNPRDGSRPLPVIILSGDIHAAGYSMVCSSRPEHRERPVIEHICSSPVASEPMSWFVEAAYQPNWAKILCIEASDVRIDTPNSPQL